MKGMPKPGVKIEEGHARPSLSQSRTESVGHQRGSSFCHILAQVVSTNPVTQYEALELGTYSCVLRKSLEVKGVGKSVYWEKESSPQPAHGLDHLGISLLTECQASLVMDTLFV